MSACAPTPPLEPTATVIPPTAAAQSDPLPTATATQAPISPPTETPASSDEAAEPTAAAATEVLGDLETYEDPDVGFALDYPASWDILAPTADIRSQAYAYAATISSWQQVGPGTDGIPDDGTKLDVVVMKTNVSNAGEAIAQRRQEITNGEMPASILSDTDFPLPGGLTARRWEIQNAFGRGIEITTVIDGHTIILGGLGDETLIDAIAGTLRLLETSE
jgi:hypothetical protein